MKSCSICNDLFPCTVESGKCWCMDYPPVLERITGDCMCEKCLKVEVKRKIEVYTQSGIPSGISEKIKSNTRLLEDIDYYIENGLYVFTFWFHLKRGSCCGNGCRHCPYGNKK